MFFLELRQMGSVYFVFIAIGFSKGKRRAFVCVSLASQLVFWSGRVKLTRYKKLVRRRWVKHWEKPGETSSTVVHRGWNLYAFIPFLLDNIFLSLKPNNKQNKCFVHVSDQGGQELRNRTYQWWSNIHCHCKYITKNNARYRPKLRNDYIILF